MKKYNFFQRMKRMFKYHFVKLFRSPGGARKVALGFAIGFGLEMLVISTASLIYILFIPIVKLAKGSLSASVIGNIIGKLSFLPVLLLPFAKIIGKAIYPIRLKLGATPFSFRELLHGNFNTLLNLLHGEVHILIGMSLFGIIFGAISYIIVYYFYEKQKARRIKKRRKKHQLKNLGIQNV